MQIQKKNDRGLMFVVLLMLGLCLVTVSFGFQGVGTRPDRSSVEDRLSVLRGNDGSWHVPEGIDRGQSSRDRAGFRDDPLLIFDVAGRRLGEVFQVYSAEEYKGLLVVTNDRGRASGIPAGFSDEAWPLDQVARDLTLRDVDSNLLEPRFYLVLDEDRLLLKVNMGKQEVGLDDVHLSVGEIRRGSPRSSGREVQR